MQKTERLVHDLIWAVNSPSLMKLTDQTSVAPPALKVSDIDPDHLAIHLLPQSGQRVGRYFERLIFYWIRHIRRCEIVAESLQLRDGKRTIGELDLLFRDQQGRLNHWELACKFYLQVGGYDTHPIDYIGPNANDTLRKKSARLLMHQLPLSIQYFPEIEIREAFVKGRIFYHSKTGSKNSLPMELTVDHLDGRWIWARELTESFRVGGQRYRILRKPFWLAEEFADPYDDDLLTTDEALQFLQNHFRIRRTPILICEFRNSTSPVRESRRWFVVPDQWPC